MSSRFGDFALKAIGILLMLAALGFAISKAPDLSLERLVGPTRQVARTPKFTVTVSTRR